MRRLGSLHREELLEHSFGAWHPFKGRERYEAFMGRLKESSLLSRPNVRIIVTERVATEEDLLAVHDKELVSTIRFLSARGGWLDGDTPVPPGTYELALVQAGAVMQGCEMIMKRELEVAVQCAMFGGHHATRRHVGRSFGFCYFNQEAVAVRFLQRAGLASKVFILDLDAHHGNGIHEIFYEDPTVLYMSLHQDPRTLYPGTGYVEEVGEGEGRGFTVNVPLPPRTTDEDYLKALRELFPPLVESFKPDLLLVLLGADTYYDDPLTALSLTMRAYWEASRLIASEADRVCGGRVMLELAGGYNVEATGRAFYIATSVMAGVEDVDYSDIEPPRDPWASERVEEVIREVKKALSPYWPGL
ncbi:MAG: histone deacetylase [Candidatus Nezhaarchaeota archaeon]|nr:histone deacetylase [Candidatus Nezhaarchaeota archaeon]